MYIDIFGFLIIAGLVWWLTYHFFYSPKARINRLWEEVFKISYKIGEQKRKQEYSNFVRVGWGPFSMVADESVIEKKEKMINALLDYYFNPNNEEDKEYIEQNRAKFKNRLSKN